MSVEEVVGFLDVDPARGLADAEARRRREKHGPNRLRAAESRSVLRILVQQFSSVVLLIMTAAAGIAIALSHWTEAVAIAAVLLINTIIGFVSEWRAVRTMEGLQKLEQPKAEVRRNGARHTLAADDLVPGDIVVLGTEDVVPADLRILESDRLRVEEAPLTGESVPVAKQVEPADEEVPLAERSSMLYKGTSIAEGTAVAVVTATGMDTELGNISSLAQNALSKPTPLQGNLDRLGRRLAWITIGVAALVAAVGLLAGQPTVLMLETAIALGVAAIPEGLPIVATIALARGMFLMARRQAVVNRLTAVETLGSTGVIFSDKTGTLTENRMRAVRLATSAGELELRQHGTTDLDQLGQRTLLVAVLCNNASLDGTSFGDPTEIALLEAGRDHGFERDRLLEDLPEVREESFDPKVMMMATFHRSGDGFEVAVKGAPAAVIGACSKEATSGGERELDEETRKQWLERNRVLAGDGLRVLAVADRRGDDDAEEPYRDLRLIGLVGLIDPPRYPFAFSENPFLKVVNRQLIKAKPAFHKQTLLKPVHRSAEFCSVCHKVHLPEALNRYRWLRGQNHYDSFLLSGVSGHRVDSFYYPPEAKKACADCHMPPKNSDDPAARSAEASDSPIIHNHAFAAANTAVPHMLDHPASDNAARLAMLQNAARVDIFGLKEDGRIEGQLHAPLRPALPVLEPGRRYLLEVVVRTTGMGHALTQGTADSNELWLDLTLSAGERTIGRSGALGEDGDVDPWAWFCNAYLLDRDGNRIDRRNAQNIYVALYNHQIPPGAAAVVHYAFTVPEETSAPIAIEAALNYRKFDTRFYRHVMGDDFRVNDLPIATLASDRLVLPVTGSILRSDQQRAIHAWERWNDYGIGLLREGKRGESRQAATAFAEVEALGRADGPLNLARVLYREGSLDEAADALHRATRMQPPAAAWSWDSA